MAIFNIHENCEYYACRVQTQVLAKYFLISNQLSYIIWVWCWQRPLGPEEVLVVDELVARVTKF